MTNLALRRLQHLARAYGFADRRVVWQMDRFWLEPALESQAGRFFVRLAMWVELGATEYVASCKLEQLRDARAATGEGARAS